MPAIPVLDFVRLLDDLDAGRVHVSSVAPGYLEDGVKALRRLAAHTNAWINAARAEARAIRLPLEVMLEIFYIYATENAPKLGSCAWEDSGWIILLVLCKTWYRKLSTDGKFWAITAPHNPERMKLAIDNVGPWKIAYELTEWLPRSTLALRNRIERRAGNVFDPKPHGTILVDRNDCAFEHLEKILRHCQSQPLDRLTELVLRNHSYGHANHDHAAWEILRDYPTVWIRARNLRVVELNGMSARIASDELTVLRLTHRPQSSARPSNDSLLDTLGRSGKKLNRLELLWAACGASKSKRTIELPVLDYLWIWGELADVADVVTSISTPQLSTSNVLVEIGAPDEWTPAVVRRLAARLLSNNGSWRDVRIRVATKDINGYGLSVIFSPWREGELTALDNGSLSSRTIPRINYTIRTRDPSYTWQHLVGALLGALAHGTYVQIFLPPDFMAAKDSVVHDVEALYPGLQPNAFTFDVRERRVVDSTPLSFYTER